MTHYYDIDGNPTTWRDWAFEFEHREVGRGIVEQLHLPNGFYVSTVWLGANHNYSDGPPLIYESMVFLSWGRRGILSSRRYSTLEQAKRGHDLLAHRWRRKKRRKHA